MRADFSVELKIKLDLPINIKKKKKKMKIIFKIKDTFWHGTDEHLKRAFLFLTFFKFSSHIFF